LQYFIAKRYAKALELSQGLLAPAYMAIALPQHSPLKRPIDRARPAPNGGRSRKDTSPGDRWRSCRRSCAPGKKKS
jgi:hypothetical protein